MGNNGCHRPNADFLLLLLRFLPRRKNGSGLAKFEREGYELITPITHLEIKISFNSISFQSGSQNIKDDPEKSAPLKQMTLGFAPPHKQTNKQSGGRGQAGGAYTCLRECCSCSLFVCFDDGGRRGKEQRRWRTERKGAEKNSTELFHYTMCVYPYARACWVQLLRKLYPGTEQGRKLGNEYHDVRFYR